MLPKIILGIVLNVFDAFFTFLIFEVVSQYCEVRLVVNADGIVVSCSSLDLGPAVRTDCVGCAVVGRIDSLPVHSIANYDLSKITDVLVCDLRLLFPSVYGLVGSVEDLSLLSRFSKSLISLFHSSNEVTQ